MKTSHCLNNLRRVFNPYPSDAHPHLLRWDPSLSAVQMILRIFYFFNFFICIWHLSTYQAFYDTRGLDLLWPVSWLDIVPKEQGINVILAVYLISSLLGVLYAQSACVRWLVFLSLLEIIALKNSFGKIGHSTHFLVLLSFICCFLPKNWHKPKLSRAVRQQVFTIFWGCQMMIMLTYTMSGIGKITCGIQQMIAGEMGAFHPYALAAHVAERLLQTNTHSLLGDWLIRYPLLGWPLMLGGIYLQFFSFWIVFRPALQRVWATALILFHLAIFFTMGINFPINAFIVALFFITSPFAHEYRSLRHWIKALPLFGWFYCRFWESPALRIEPSRVADGSLRVLILTSSTGGGHDMRARALKSWAEQEKDLNLHVSLCQTLEETHGIYRFGVGLYNWIQKHWPALHHLYFNYLEFFPKFKRSRHILGAERFLKTLRRMRPNIIVSVHGSLNHGFFELVRSLFWKDHVRCATYCGELEDGYGFSRHWVNPAADLFIGAVPETCKAARRHGMPSAKTWVGGFLLDPSFWLESWSEEKKHAFIIREWNFDPKKMILVLGTGGMGANNHLAFLRELVKAKVYPQVLVLCGRSAKTLFQVEAWAREHPEIAVRALSYTSKMADILRCASVVVIRPGTGATSEAMLMQCPILFNGVGGIMPQERITLEYCKAKGIASCAARPRDLPAMVDLWMREPGLLEKIRGKMARIVPQQSPRAILERLIKLQAP